MGYYVLVVLLPMLLFIAYHDIRWRRIPNYFTIPLLLFGLAVHFKSAGIAGLKSALVAIVVGGGMFILLYWMKWMGAGDVKLVAAMGAWLGMERIFPAVFYTFMAGGCIALLQLGFYARANKRHEKNTSKEIRSNQSGPEDGMVITNKPTVPYGVAIIIGALYTLWKIS